MMHYVIVVDANQNNKLTVWSFKQLKYANAVADNQNGAGAGITAYTATDDPTFGLHGIPTPTLVLLHNAIRPEKTITRFADRATAEKRMVGVLEVLAKPGEVPVLPEKVVSERDAVATPSNEQGDQMASTKSPRKRAATKPKAERAAGAGRKSQYAGKVIRKVETKNPRRDGTAGFSSWEALKSGMTYEKYIEAGGRRQDLEWDLERGWVKLENA